MKTIAGILGALSVALLLCGCNHVVENTNIPDWRVAFIIDVSISGTDNDLAEGLVANARIYDEEHPAIQSYGVGAYGYSGVVVTRGIDDMLYAFDTCCPHEAKRGISLEIEGYYMTCPECGIRRIGLPGRGAVAYYHADEAVCGPHVGNGQVFGTKRLLTINGNFR